MVPYLYTHSDAISHLSDWAGFTGSVSADMLRKIKRSIDNAYRALTNLKKWSYYYYRGRINTVALYNTGTIAYTNSTRTVTLTGGTFPSWSGQGVLRIGAVDYQVVNGSATSTTLILSVNCNPGADVAAGTTYTLYQDVYPLPVNFSAMGTVRDTSRGRVLTYKEPNEMIAMRMPFQLPIMPFDYTITGDTRYMGVSSIQFYPPPDIIYQYDYEGVRYPRPFTQPVPYTTGTVTSSGTTITGVGTAWTNKMIGCVIRFSNNGTAPTGMYGSNPYYLQRIITSYTSSTILGIDQALDAEVAAQPYEISDPIDMEAAFMYTAFLSLCQWELGKLMNRDDFQRLEEQYMKDLRLAMESDSRSFDNKPGGRRFHQRVSDYTQFTDATT